MEPCICPLKPFPRLKRCGLSIENLDVQLISIESCKWFKGEEKLPIFYLIAEGMINAMVPAQNFQSVTTYWDWLVLSNCRYAKHLNREL